MNNTLIQGLINGDETAYADFYKSTYQKAYLLAFKITGSKEDAEDVVSSAYVKFYQKIDTLKDYDKLESWFIKIVVNQAKNEVIKKKPLVFSQIDEEETGLLFEESIESKTNKSPEEVVIDDEQAKIIKEAMESLNSNQSLCLQMYYFDELSVKEIAEAFEISENTVKTRLRLGRNNLQKELEKRNIKMYSVSAILWYFSNTSRRFSIPQINIGELLEVSTAGVSAATSSTVKTIVSATKTRVAKKIIAGIVTLSVVASGTAVAVGKYNHNKEKMTLTSKNPSSLQQTSIVGETEQLKTDDEKNIAGAIAVEIAGSTYYSDINDKCIYKIDSENEKTQFIKNVTVYQLFVYEDNLIYVDETEQAAFMLNIKEIDSRKKITEKRLIIEDGDGKSINGLCSIYIRNNKLIYVSNETGNPPYYDCGEQTVYSYDFKNGTNAVLFSCPSTITCLASSEYVYETYEYDIETNEYMTKYYDEQGNIISTKIKASNDCLDEETKLYEDDNYIVLNQYYEVDSIQHKKYYIVNKNDGASYTILDLDATNVIAYMSDTPVFDTELKEFTIVKDKLYYIELTSYSDLSLSTKQKIEIIDLERVVR